MLNSDRILTVSVVDELFSIIYYLYLFIGSLPKYF